MHACYALVYLTAAIDPESTVAEEIRKERRRIKREEKKKNQEKEEKIRKWKEQQEKLAEKERQKFLDRQEQVNNMTPLERIDDIGSLDDNTIRLLEKRKQRLQRRYNNKDSSDDKA
jgi:acetyl-CoA carboxylase carboxyltransferase component